MEMGTKELKRVSYALSVKLLQKRRASVSMLPSSCPNNVLDVIASGEHKLLGVDVDVRLRWSVRCRMKSGNGNRKEATQMGGPNGENHTQPTMKLSYFCRLSLVHLVVKLHKKIVAQKR